MKQRGDRNQSLPHVSENKMGLAGVNYLSPDRIILPQTIKYDDSVEILSLPSRLENALKFGKIRTVKDVCFVSEEQLREIRNIGQKTIEFLREVKKKVAEKFTSLENESRINEVAAIRSETLISSDKLVSSLLERCESKRSREIIQRRYGLITGERQTLEEVGEFYGLTRERIRQIQSKTLRRLKHPATLVRKPVTKLIEDAMFRTGGIISAEEADTQISRILGETTEDGSAILDLLCDLGWIQSFGIGDIVIYSPKFDSVSLPKLSDRIVSVIKGCELGLDVHTIIKKTRMFRKIHDARFDSELFVLRYCQLDPRLEEMSMVPAWTGVIFKHYASGHFSKKKWVALMIRVLEEEQMPLHFTEIANKVNDLIAGSKRQLEVRRAHSILIEDEAFAHSGIHGTYGLTSWGLRKETTPRLVDECLKKAGFPLHWKQIFNYVSKYKDSRPASIVSILETRHKYTKVNPGIFWFRAG